MNKILMVQVLNLFDIGTYEFARLFDPELEKVNIRHLNSALNTALLQAVADDLGLSMQEVTEAYVERLAMEEKGEI